MSPDAFHQLLEAQRLSQESLLRRRGVVGVAIGFRNYREQVTDQLAMAVLVEQKKPIEALSAEDLVPADVNGARTDVIEIGRLEAQINPRERFRPNIPAGVSIGHYAVTAGTLGAIVFDKATGEPLILSNNHVLANSNRGAIGDAILQPGTTDHGVRPDDVVAKLHRFEMLRFFNSSGPLPETPPAKPPPLFPAGGCDIVGLFQTVGNALSALSGSSRRLTAVTLPQAQASRLIVPNALDGALARPVNPMMFQQSIAEIGRPNGIVKASLGMPVRKHGRTTGYTEGSVTLLNATVDVSYGDNLNARFSGQTITTPMSQGGDSGALVMAGASLKAVGLLFAGSRRATIFTPIQTVLDKLGVRL